ncbi:MAG TPA: multicopper oxidase domain-containing protein [Verrucomicrobiae bacterium]|nr:multicopper oxidase domain-containing protein [Verrucomicrobiae bacterium]
MPISRRDFLRRSAFAAGATLARQSGHQHAAPIQARPALDPNSLAKFVDPLPIPALAHSMTTRPSPTDPKIKIPFYRVSMQAFDTHVHRDLKPTRMWGFGGSFPGPTFDVASTQEILVEWANELPHQHFLPIDHTLHGAEKDQPEVRSVAHVHGAKVPPESDGYPENWLVPGKSAVYHYPNQQDAAMLWYHDHAMGINRLNIFAGLAGAYIVRDKVEDALHLPPAKYEVPLVICDRMFDKDGQLYYPVSDKPDTPWIPEFFGDAHLVNGKLFPFLEVEPRKYRFRVLNAGNGRFYHLGLSNKLPLHQIGTDQGLLAAPVAAQQIMIAPGERLDLVVDFKECAGTQILLTDDFVPLMQFRVSATSVKDDSALPLALRPMQKLQESAAAKTRFLSLDEIDDKVQNPVRMLLNGKAWHDPVTENPTLNSTEIWAFVNPTDDSHPIHLHLVKFQILDRRKIENFAYLSRQELHFTGPVVPPDPDEAGWKDTVRAHPGMLTRIIARFEGYPGRYVWHCHILEHEDNEMMRPFDVLQTR